MTSGKESIPFFGSHMTPEFSNYLHCGSVRLSIDDPADFVDFAGRIEADSTAFLYRNRFDDASMGRVMYADLSVRSDQEGRTTLEALIEHSHPIKSPRYFSGKYVNALVRKLPDKDVVLTSEFTDAYVDAYSIHGDHGTIQAETVKQTTDIPFSPRECRRNSLRLRTVIDADTDPRHIVDMLEIWGISVDMLANRTLQQRRPELREGINVDLRGFTGSVADLDLLMRLQAYDDEALFENSGITLPRIDFEAIDLRNLSRELAGDEEVISASLAGCAFNAVRIFGKTGIMPAVTTQSLMDAAREFRQARNY